MAPWTSAKRRRRQAVRRPLRPVCRAGFSGDRGPHVRARSAPDPAQVSLGWRRVGNVCTTRIWPSREVSLLASWQSKGHLSSDAFYVECIQGSSQSCQARDRIRGSRHSGYRPARHHRRRPRALKRRVSLDNLWQLQQRTPSGCPAYRRIRYHSPHQRTSRHPPGAGTL